MKKCPVCGVMMGDNVARCFMCKYDFQKAAREGEEAARKDASINVISVEKEANGRAAEKKAEGEKIIADAKAKSRLEIEAMERQLEGEKLRLEQEYVEIRRKSLEERSKLDTEMSAIRAQVEQEAELMKDARQQREKLIDGAKAAAQGEAAKIIDQIHEETNRLAIQVQQELAEAMAEKQRIFDDAARLAEEAAEAQKNHAAAQQEYEKHMKSVEEIKLRAKQEAEEIKKQAAIEAQELKSRAEADSAARLQEIDLTCADAIAQAQNAQQEAENTKTMATEELAAYVAEAKAAIAAAEEAENARRRIDDEVQAIIEKAETYKVQAEEAGRKADEEAAAIYSSIETARKAAQTEEQEILRRAEDARVKAKNDEQIYIDELEATQSKVQAEIDKIQEDRRVLWATAEQEAAALTRELQDAKEMAQEALKARQAAEEQAKEAQRQAAEEAERIIYEAEKRAVILKEMGISDSEKGRIAKKYEEDALARQAEIAALQKTLDERNNKLDLSEQKVRVMMEELENLRENQLKAGFFPVSVPMEYVVEVIAHNSSSEVNAEALAEALARRGALGWKLHSLVNDEGGKLQSALGGAEKVSLTGTTATKQDRVILIFERVKPDNTKNTSSL